MNSLHKAEKDLHLLLAHKVLEKVSLKGQVVTKVLEAQAGPLKGRPLLYATFTYEGYPLAAVFQPGGFPTLFLVDQVSGRPTKPFKGKDQNFRPLPPDTLLDTLCHIWWGLENPPSHISSLGFWVYGLCGERPGGSRKLPTAVPVDVLMDLVKPPSRYRRDFYAAMLEASAAGADTEAFYQLALVWMHCFPSEATCQTFTTPRVFPLTRKTPVSGCKTGA